jgi:hypothetical protein
MQLVATHEDVLSGILDEFASNDDNTTITIEMRFTKDTDGRIRFSGARSLLSQGRTVRKCMRARAGVGFAAVGAYVGVERRGKDCFGADFVEF